VTSDRVEGLRRALELMPDNHGLRLTLAETLAAEERPEEAAAEYAVLHREDALPVDALVDAGRAAVQAGDLRLAGELVDAARRAGLVEGLGSLQREIDEVLGLGGTMRVAETAGPDGTAPPVDFESAPTVNFDDVGGLDDVKKAIHRTIILPYQRPELYERYGRRAGGGVLLYGPPGCGKTMLARATASECGLPFSNVRIEEIVDPFFGVSERNLHDAFVQARRASPCVLFLDEIDALGFARRKHSPGSVGRPLVDQLLQELDAIGADNAGILVLAATNAPWDVDEALKRPGRFDRTLFVPPPDEPARRRVLELLVRRRPADEVDLKQLAKRTRLFSGADLVALVERAVDAVIDEALESGDEPPLRMAHLEGALQGMRPTTLEWLATAKNYVEFANEGGRYDEVRAFLVSSEAKAWRD
jgi:transitional endoplasmic reticulum ATPase